MQRVSPTMAKEPNDSSHPPGLPFCVLLDAPSPHPSPPNSQKGTKEKAKLNQAAWQKQGESCVGIGIGVDVFTTRKVTAFSLVHVRKGSGCHN